MEHLTLYEDFQGKKTLLYLHGFKGDVNYHKTGYMRGKGYSIVAPHLFYEEKPVWDMLEEIFDMSKPDAIIGHSLGAYLGYYLSQKHNVPALMMNPAFGSTTAAPDGWDNLQPVPDSIKDIPPHPDNKLAILGKRDIVLNNAEVERMLKGKATLQMSDIEHDVPADKFYRFFDEFETKYLK